MSKGINDDMRLPTIVPARHATLAEATDVEPGAGAVVLVTDAVDALPDRTPLRQA